MNDNNSLEIRTIDQFRTLCLIDKVTGETLKQWTPFGNDISEFRRIKPNCNIIKEDSRQFPKDSNGNQANIYCLDDAFNIKWKINVPLTNNFFPNPIIWDTEMELNPDKGLIFKINSNVFTCSDWRGVTLTVDYENGIQLKAELTK